MIRVVNEGSLCTRMGRFLQDNFEIDSGVYKNKEFNKHVCYNEDIEYDYGGHTWAGRISWLRKAWNHIPLNIENCEDFWISAILRTFYNISTKIPKCPCPEANQSIIPDMCAVSISCSDNHIDAIINNKTIPTSIRTLIRKELIEKINYPTLNRIKPEYVKNIHKKFFYGTKYFNLSGDYWKDALYWQ